jgi:hypothetical protein
MPLDFAGIATLVGAICGGLISLGTFAMQVISWYDRRRDQREQAEHKELLNDIAAKVTTIKAENEA